MNLLAIDPGNTQSAYVVVDPTTCRPLRFAKIDNDVLQQMLYAGAFDDCDHTAIEMIASYGMAVGAEVFDTCVWIGRFYELSRLRHRGIVETVKRLPVKLHHCHDSKAKDPNITRALVDRFAPGASNYGKGTKADPGWFFGFAKDVWQAYALAVYVADTTPQIPVAAAPSNPTVAVTAPDPAAVSTSTPDTAAASPDLQGALL